MVVPLQYPVLPRLDLDSLAQSTLVNVDVSYDAPDCFAEVLEFMAFIKLRISHRDLHRPYEIPLDTVGVCFLLLPAAVFVVLLATLSSRTTWIVSGGALVVGWAIYPCLQLAKRRQWCEFRATTLYEGGDAVGAERATLYSD